jgi:hypothetical protein
LPTCFPDDLAVQELAFSSRALAGIPAGRSPFGPTQSAPLGAGSLGQLAALLGRDVAGGGAGSGS